MAGGPQQAARAGQHKAITGMYGPSGLSFNSPYTTGTRDGTSHIPFPRAALCGQLSRARAKSAFNTRANFKKPINPTALCVFPLCSVHSYMAAICEQTEKSHDRVAEKDDCICRSTYKQGVVEAKSGRGGAGRVAHLNQGRVATPALVTTPSQVWPFR